MTAAERAVDRPKGEETLPDHLAPLDGDRWAMWRWVGLRSAGFPIERVLGLASREMAAAADRCLEAADPETSGTFSSAFESAITTSTAALQEVARDQAFREAVAWQNRRALHTGVDVLLHRPPGVQGRSSKHRQKEALVTNYLQRYCAKNDTIGFFGPVGWARVVDGGPPLTVESGPTLLATRTAYFEGWCIDALGEALAKDPALLPWLAPRRMPYIRVEGRVLRPPLAPPVSLTSTEAAALLACDGERTAREVAALLLTDPSLFLLAEEEVFAVLRKLHASRWISWTLEVPAEGLYPEQSLRRRLELVEDDSRREVALAGLDELVASRLELNASAGDAAEVDRALEVLEATFVRLTGTAPTRREGESYSGRTLAYEDCRRDADVRLGPGLSATLGPPLSLVLAAASWLTVEAAVLYRRAFREIHVGLARKTGPTVPFASFWFLAHPLIFGERSSVVDSLTKRLRARWASVLTVPAGEHRVALDVDELRPRVARAFPARDGAWRSARYHSPDVMIAAHSAEALAEGQFEYVLGEVHPAINTLRPAFFTAQHPSPEELLRAVERDLPESQVVTLFSRASGGSTLRMSRSLVSPKDYRLVFAADTCGVPVGRALPIGSLDVEDSGDSLEVRTRGGALRFDIMDVLADLLSLRVLHVFEIAPPSRHSPRINFGPLVACRETWRFAPPTLAFADRRDEAERFLEARRWMRAHGMPRFVFIRARSGEKPIFLDFDSLLSIDVFCRAVRKATSDADVQGDVVVTEMLPAPDQMWLVDSERRSYASELRMVALERER